MATKKKTIIKRKPVKRKPKKAVDEEVFITAGGKVGRPREYKTVSEFNQRANEYFEDIGAEKPSSYEIALYMGFQSRQSLYDYEKRPEFSYSVHVIQTFIKAAHEKRLYSDRPQGAIFALSTLGWVVKTSVENFNHDINVEI